MYYIIGDIHGHLVKLEGLFKKLEPHITSADSVIFLGDYIAEVLILLKYLII